MTVLYKAEEKYAFCWVDPRAAFASPAALPGPCPPTYCPLLWKQHGGEVSEARVSFEQYLLRNLKASKQ